MTLREYPMCRQQVTVYRKTESGISRQVLSGCYLEEKETRSHSTWGQEEEKPFLLIVPGATQQVFAGDRIYAGEGPEIAPEDWADFIPAVVPGLYQAAYAETYGWQGKLWHTEAGCR